ncbi:MULTISPECIES: cytochrome P450 [unclassified Streptomyces]|uniref:cytochrome P450 n=1 Tax=unclassified Streptomyces TaxID=2593676 RepID=UPI0028C4EA9B|nr:MULTISPECIES: cytochrome P450 [unclassified Streptomyces]WNO74169.1 cytochrome P450 [Streptomyces sp. AM8-1-1]
MTVPPPPTGTSRPPAGGRCPVATPLYGPDLDGDTMPAFYEKLRREHGPVAPVTIAPGMQAWLVLGHRELLRLTREEQDFSHDPRRWTLLREGRVPLDSPIMPMVGWRPALLFTDGQQHRRMRSAVSHALACINGHELRRSVRATAERLIASFADRREADLVPHYARKLPLQVITGLLGLDERTGQQLVQAIAGMVAANADSVNAAQRMNTILQGLIEEKRRRPGNDVTSSLLHHPARLTDEEVLHNLVVMFVAGNQTTVNWIATTLRILLCDPAFRSSLTGGHLSVDDALDLVLWRYPPTQNFPARYATRDLEFGGQHIRTGDMLLLGLAGANQDPEVLPPDGVPVTGNRSHLAFGAGPHTCPAQDPARLITRTAVDTIRHRLPDLELAVPESDLGWIKSPWSKGLAALPVRFTEPQLPQAAQSPTAEQQAFSPTFPQSGEPR